MKRAIVTTGGTGGHIFPALAVAGELRAQNPGIEMLFVGGPGPEAKLAAKAGLAFAGLPVRGVLGKGFKALPALARLGVSLIKAIRLIRAFEPQVVAGFGGYAGFCPVLGAWLLGVPTAVHEQNSVPGMTNRILGRLVKKVLITYPDQAGAFPSSKVVLTGNPVRPEIAALAQAESARVVSKRILVLGGSQGARAVNRVILAAWPSLAEQGISLWHQTGQADFPEMAKAYEDQANVRVEPFIEDMAEAYSWADLVIGRAGASTLAEVCAAGKASVLVPFPFATHNHQMVNASFLEKAGAAKVIEEKTLNAELLADTVKEIFAPGDRLTAMGRAALSLAKPQAARDIALEITRLAA